MPTPTPDIQDVALSFVLTTLHGGPLAVLLLQRGGGQSFPYRWCVPGGKVEEAETVGNAALRELEEETGIGVMQLSKNALRLPPITEFEEPLQLRMWPILYYVETVPPIRLESKFVGYGLFTLSTAERLDYSGHTTPGSCLSRVKTWLKTSEVSWALVRGGGQQPAIPAL